MHDLLAPPVKGHPGDAVPSMDIRHDADGAVSVPGLIKESVSNLEDVMTVFKRGSSNRCGERQYYIEIMSFSLPYKGIPKMY